jgi:hypothetical protein
VLRWCLYDGEHARCRPYYFCEVKGLIMQLAGRAAAQMPLASELPST